MTDNLPTSKRAIDPPQTVFVLGNENDDDGQALDQYFEGMDVGPQVFDGDVYEREALPINSRLIGRSVTVGTADAQIDPVMLFPPDPNRIHLKVIVRTAPLIFGSDRGEIYSGALLPIGAHDFFGHTGGVWIKCDAAGTTAGVDAWSVTK